MHWDVSDKEAKHLGRYHGESVFKGLVTATNEVGEIRMKQRQREEQRARRQERRRERTRDKTLEEKREELRKLEERALAAGNPRKA